jgi:predicted signal transduction protein with EAL and GGDEF domain
MTAVGVASGVLAARLGGDEFAVLIQDVTPAQGDAVTAELDEQADEVARLGADIRNAIDSGQFRLAYQPIVELPHGRTAGVEALIRWEHPVSRSTSSRWTSPSWTASRWPAGTPSSPRR